MCVVFNYVHVFALFRGSLYLFSLCVSRVVFACGSFCLLREI